MSMTYDHTPRPPATLLAEWQHAREQLAGLRAGGMPLTGHAAVDAEEQGLAALAAAGELSRAVTAERWPTVHDLLLSGVDLDTIAHALDLPVQEVRSGIRGWAKAQRTLLRSTGTSGMTQAQYDAAVALVPETWAVNR